MLGDPAAAGLAMLVVGGASLAAGQPWLFPSLGPTALGQIEYPEHITARLYNTVVGHLAAAAVAFATVIVTGTARLPPATERLTTGRLLAVTVALALTIGATRLLHASHPPAASTSLLIALGAFSPTIRDAATIVMGVLLIAVAGSGIRRFRIELARHEAVHPARRDPPLPPP